MPYPFAASLLFGRPDKSIIFVRFSASEYIDSLDTFYKLFVRLAANAHSQFRSLIVGDMVGRDRGDESL